MISSSFDGVTKTKFYNILTRLCSLLCLQDCGMQLTDEPDKRCYPLNGRLMCRGCHIQQLSNDVHSTSGHQIEVSSTVEFFRENKKRITSRNYVKIIPSISERTCLLPIHKLSNFPENICSYSYMNKFLFCFYSPHISWVTKNTENYEFLTLYSSVIYFCLNWTLAN